MNILIGRALAAATLAAGATSALCAAAPAADPGLRDRADTGRPEVFGAALERELRAGAAKHSAKSDSPLEIGLVFHVLSGAAGEGNYNQATLDVQLGVLNDAYRPTGIHFHIAQLHRYPDSPYFAGGCFPTIESGIRMKTELAVDTAHLVNIYTCKLDLPYIAGYGTLPDEFAENDPRHGVVIDYATLPGSAAPLDLGHTLVHELGHYFGLLHTFQGACTEPGDGVADTPAESVPGYGCALERDTCPQDGKDPVTNFMDYSDDACTDNFTPLQAARMHTLIGTYRPSLVAAGAFAIGPGITGNWFDPNQSGHGIIVEVLPANQMLLDWFVFAPEGGPAWIVATGTISGNTAVLHGFQATGPGGRFPPNFDPAHVQNQAWGTLTLEFADCNNGRMSWQPTSAGYTAGSMTLTRLTLPAGLACP